MSTWSPNRTITTDCNDKADIIFLSTIDVVRTVRIIENTK